jgi:hypothetical protein
MFEFNKPPIREVQIHDEVFAASREHNADRCGRTNATVGVA